MSADRRKYNCWICKRDFFGVPAYSIPDALIPHTHAGRYDYCPRCWGVKTNLPYDSVHAPASADPVATEADRQVRPTSTPLQLALEMFNTVFERDLRAPILPEYVEMAAEFAELRGRHDVADELRFALRQASTEGGAA